MVGKIHLEFVDKLMDALAAKLGQLKDKTGEPG